MYRAVRAATAAFMRSPARFVVGPVVTPLDRALFHLSGGRLKLSAARCDIRIFRLENHTSEERR